MKIGIVWPTKRADIEQARADVRDLIAGITWDEVTALEAKVTDAVSHQPIGLVLAALTVALGRAAAHRFGPITLRPLILIAVAVQFAWQQAAATKPTHH